MATSPEHDESISELLTDLENAAKVPAKVRASKISSRVDKVCSKAYEEGFSSASLGRVIDIITIPNELDQASINSLIRNLYPAGKVSDSIVTKVVASLGHGRAKPSYNAQAALLKWLVMVYDVLENPKVLSQLYGILFNLLDTIAIRSHLCHVLSLITRRKHVRPYRIQILMELTRQAGNEPPLVGLMRVFKDYYPDVIVGDVTSGRASVFTHPNHEWRQRLGEIQTVHFQKTQDGLPLEQRTFRANRRGTRQTKSSVVPEVHTSRAQESSVTLEEIEDVHDFVQRLEKIEPPNQLVAVIQDSLLQKFLQLRSSEVYARRVDSWLMAFFEDQLEAADTSEIKILEMLVSIQAYTHYTKKLPPTCSAYLNSMITSWNGVVGRQIILDLLSYTPLGPFQDLYYSIFQAMEEALLDDEAEQSKLDLLTFYNKLLNNWAVAVLIDPQLSPTAKESISALIKHVDTLALSIVQSSQSITTLSTVLTFYESIAFIITQPSLNETVRIIIPPTELIYTLHFTPSLTILSRLCGILALYKRAFEMAIGPKASVSKGAQSYPKDYINRFNGFLMDICNCIWRSRAFNTADMNALGCDLHPDIAQVLDTYVRSLGKNLTLMSLFSLSFSPVLCLLSISYVRDLEDAAGEEIEVRHAGPVTMQSLKLLEKDGGLKYNWADYRLGFLHYLDKKGVMGVGELMYNTMKQLMPAKKP
ncbi:Inner kinetochore subunit [Lachnellula hyalina]|uniref:Inner kinetochore subunit n=1 Tax=Lachnellula hyalina TaxID=1316788 RepID=A0A8H8R6R4_9HELO|nr:Inner kinetochore subunit [Lachnellula hyalina]TVY29041.1 Inner kinetochore subunit [Lachnellula hyalina]